MRGSLCLSAVLAAIVMVTAAAGFMPAADTRAAIPMPAASLPAAPEELVITPAPFVTAPALATVATDLSPSASPAASDSPSPTLPRVPSSPPPATAGPISIGYRISIPRLGIDLPIAEGDVQRDVEDMRTPEGFAFHLPGTALPGQNGNTFLYAHARRGMFLMLWNARLGDEVVVTGPGGRLLVYVVSEILPRVAPTDVSSTRPTASERLTLQTSTGPSPSDPRFVVFAFLRGT